MMTSRSFRRSKGAIGMAAVALVGLSACGGGDSDGDATSGGGAGGDAIDCSVYEEFGDLDGKKVTIYTSIITPEDTPHIESYKPFEECTGVEVTYEGSKEFEAQLQVRVKGGNAPDLAIIPQPGLLKTLVETGKVVEAPKQTAANVDEFFGEDWKAYGTVDGKFYAAPLGANVKSFVWYSPAMFEEKGYEVPQTWSEMMDLSKKIAEDTKGEEGVKPWCAGIGSGDATGWPATDWMEDIILRTAGPDVYDQWVNHEIPFNDPQVVEALGEMGKILKDPAMINGGLGDVKTIATTEFQAGGLPILDGMCYMHRQASFYAANWVEAGAEVGEDADVWAFYLPAMEADGEKPVLGGGEFIAAFDDRPEVQAFQTYLSSDVWANEKAKNTEGGWVSANSGLDVANLKSPLDKLAAETLQDEQSVFRFDGSDQMPGAVGAGTFWKEMTNWIATDKDDKAVLDAIEKSWPASSK